MRLSIIIFLTFLTATLAAQAPATDDTAAEELLLEKIVKGTHDFANNKPIEKVHVHFDRSYYLVSDTAWFSIYVVDIQLLPSEMSKVVYLDWINKEGAVKRHQALKLIDGKASGDNVFVDFPEGAYQVRAYTNLMLNDAPEHFFYARINVINPSKTPKANAPVVADKDKIDVQFFPEGGPLVYGLESQVAFKAINALGEGIEFNGQVVDDLGAAVTFAKAVHKGMGVFVLKPVSGRTYKVRYDKGTAELPKPLSSGIVMTVTNRQLDFIRVRIQATPDLVPGNFYLTGQARADIHYRNILTMNRPVAVIDIPRSDVPEGILQLTLFNANAAPVSERLVYSKTQNNYGVTVAFNKVDYGPRELVTMTIDVVDQEGVPVETRMSVGVTDMDFHTRRPSMANIRTQLLLQSDLKGRIEDPGWYFESSSAERLYALDLVMLTNGWRKFNWLEALDAAPDTILYEAELGLTISGQVILERNGNSLSDGTLVLLTNTKGESGFFEASADPAGNFKLRDMNFTDSTQFVWQIRNSKGKRTYAQVKFTDPELPAIDSTFLGNGKGTGPDESVFDLVARLQASGAWNNYSVRIMDEIEVTGKKIENTMTKNDFHRLAVEPNTMESMNYVDVVHMLDDKFPNIIVLGSGNNATVRIRVANRSLQGPEVPPMVILDGMPITTDGPGGVASALNIVPVSSVERIEVLTTAAAAIYGARAGAGAIAIYTKKGVPKYVEDNTPGKGILRAAPPGYSWPRSFYEPKYTGKEDPAVTPDYRMTLYWNPELKTDASGRATVRFHNSDIAKKLEVVVEGIDGGTPFFKVK